MGEGDDENRFLDRAYSSERELRREFHRRLRDNARTLTRRAGTSDICIRGRVAGEETGEPSEAVMRLFYVQDLLCVDVVTLREGRPVAHRYFDAGPDLLGLEQRDTIFAAKIAALTDPKHAELIPQEEYGALRFELIGR